MRSSGNDVDRLSEKLNQKLLQYSKEQEREQNATREKYADIEEKKRRVFREIEALINSESFIKRSRSPEDIRQNNDKSASRRLTRREESSQQLAPETVDSSSSIRSYHINTSKSTNTSRNQQELQLSQMQIGRESHSFNKDIRSRGTSALKVIEKITNCEAPVYSHVMPIQKCTRYTGPENHQIRHQVRTRKSDANVIEANENNAQSTSPKSHNGDQSHPEKRFRVAKKTCCDEPSTYQLRLIKQHHHREFESNGSSNCCDANHHRGEQIFVRCPKDRHVDSGICHHIVKAKKLSHQEPDEDDPLEQNHVDRALKKNENVGQLMNQRRISNRNSSVVSQGTLRRSGAEIEPIYGNIKRQSKRQSKRNSSVLSEDTIRSSSDEMEPVYRNVKLQAKRPSKRNSSVVSQDSRRRSSDGIEPVYGKAKRSSKRNSSVISQDTLMSSSEEIEPVYGNVLLQARRERGDRSPRKFVINMSQFFSDDFDTFQKNCNPSCFEFPKDFPQSLLNRNPLRTSRVVDKVTGAKNKFHIDVGKIISTAQAGGTGQESAVAKNIQLSVRNKLRPVDKSIGSVTINLRQMLSKMSKHSNRYSSSQSKGRNVCHNLNDNSAGKIIRNEEVCKKRIIAENYAGLSRSSNSFEELPALQYKKTEVRSFRNAIPVLRDSNILTKTRSNIRERNSSFSSFDSAIGKKLIKSRIPVATNSCSKRRNRKGVSKIPLSINSSLRNSSNSFSGAKRFIHMNYSNTKFKKQRSEDEMLLENENDVFLSEDIDYEQSETCYDISDKEQIVVDLSDILQKVFEAEYGPLKEETNSSEVLADVHMEDHSTNVHESQIFISTAESVSGSRFFRNMSRLLSLNEITHNDTELMDDEAVLRTLTEQNYCYDDGNSFFNNYGETCIVYSERTHSSEFEDILMKLLRVLASDDSLTYNANNSEGSIGDDADWDPVLELYRDKQGNWRRFINLDNNDEQSETYRSSVTLSSESLLQEPVIDNPFNTNFIAFPSFLKYAKDWKNKIGKKQGSSSIEEVNHESVAELKSDCGLIGDVSKGITQIKPEDMNNFEVIEDRELEKQASADIHTDELESTQQSVKEGSMQDYPHDALVKDVEPLVEAVQVVQEREPNIESSDNLNEDELCQAITAYFKPDVVEQVDGTTSESTLLLPDDEEALVQFFENNIPLYRMTLLNLIDENDYIQMVKKNIAKIPKVTKSGINFIAHQLHRKDGHGGLKDKMLSLRDRLPGASARRDKPTSQSEVEKQPEPPKPVSEPPRPPAPTKPRPPSPRLPPSRRPPQPVQPVPRKPPPRPPPPKKLPPPGPPPAKKLPPSRPPPPKKLPPSRPPPPKKLPPPRPPPPKKLPAKQKSKKGADLVKKRSSIRSADVVLERNRKGKGGAMWRIVMKNGKTGKLSINPLMMRNRTNRAEREKLYNVRIRGQSQKYGLGFNPFKIYNIGEKGSGLNARGGLVQDFYQLREKHLRDGTLFVDTQFPANDSSLFYSQRPDRHYRWMRPHEFIRDPKLFVEGFSRFDVQQGELGDCWLLAAAANLTLDQRLFFQVVPDDQAFDEKYAGIFHFRFWQYGRWIDVVIDDLLPTYRNKLIYLHSAEDNEFWSALLEKAYAKLHGSYEALKGGSTCEAMEDFTGGVTEMYETQNAPPDLFQIIKKAFERKSLMGCSIEPDPNVLEAETAEGLIRGHAYSITKIRYVDIRTPNTSGKIPLLRLRNPWGNEIEWNGAWSDKSREWTLITESEKERLGITFDDDGEFWMSFKDFVHYFDRIEICNLNPDSVNPDDTSGKRWELSYYEGSWVRGVTAGGCRNYIDTFANNPQYRITLTEVDEEENDGKCTVIVALMQKNRRQQRKMGLDVLTIGFAIYYLPDPSRAPKPLDKKFFKFNASIARSPSFINLREVSCRFRLPPGVYCIVPTTFEPNEEGQFLIRVFSEHKNQMQYVNSDNDDYSRDNDDEYDRDDDHENDHGDEEDDDEPPRYKPPSPPPRDPSNVHHGGGGGYDSYFGGGGGGGFPSIPFFNSSRFNFSFQSPDQGGQQASAPPYPNQQQAPYPTQAPPYPTQQPPYPTQQPPYPTQQPPYPSQGQFPAYPNQYAGYPPYNNPPYPPQGGYPPY